MRFVALDSLRGICAVLVCLFHLPLAYALAGSAFIQHSYLFVDFFFVLSGFVICHAYGDRLTTSSLPVFILRRLGRLWPLHLFVLVVLVVMQLGVWGLHHYGLSAGHAPFEGRFAPVALIRDIFFLNSFGIGDAVTWNGPAWSISAEFWTYLVFAALVIHLRGRLLAAALALAGGALLVLYTASPTFMDATYNFGFLRCVAGFCTGVVTHRIWMRHLAAAKAGPWTHRMGWLAAAAAVLFVIFCGETVWSLLAPVVFAFVVLAFAHGQSQDGGALSRLLALPAFQAAGRWSYSIYMVHATIIFVALNAARLLAAMGIAPVMADRPGDAMMDFSALGGPLANELAVLAYLAVVLATAALTYRYIECPARDRVNRLAAQWRQGPSSQPSRSAASASMSGRPISSL